MILCDTNILVEFYKNNNAIIQELRQIGSHNLTISVITRAELYYGAIDKNELNCVAAVLHSFSRIGLSGRRIKLWQLAGRFPLRSEDAEFPTYSNSV